MEHVTDDVRELVKRTALACINQKKCLCVAWMRQYPYLRNDIGHVIFRFPKQWATIFGVSAGAVLGGHARTAIFPTDDEVQSQLSSLQARLDTMKLLLSFLHPDPTEPLIGVNVGDLMTDIAKLCAQDTALLSVQFPSLLGNSVVHISRQVHESGMVGGVFDKKLHVASGVCRKLLDTHLLMDVIFGDKFSIWGWGATVRHAKVLAVKEIVRRARDGGVLAQACSLHLGHPDLLEPTQAERFFQSLLCTEDVSVHLAPSLCPPTLFSMLKWKSIEHGAEALIKWREVIAFCKVPLKRYARVIGRCLQILVKLFYLDSTTIGFPLMLGTRDFGQACIRLSSDTSCVTVC